jgi:hypothetical protein
MDLDTGINWCNPCLCTDRLFSSLPTMRSSPLEAFLDILYLLEREYAILSAAMSIVHWLIERGKWFAAETEG